jgi:hypothetical protein
MIMNIDVMLIIILLFQVLLNTYYYCMFKYVSKLCVRLDGKAKKNAYNIEAMIRLKLCWAQKWDWGSGDSWHEMLVFLCTLQIANLSMYLLFTFEIWQNFCLL